MIGSTVLEVAIGVIFVYWLLSLFCSAITELIAGRIQNLRTKALEAGIRNLFNDPNGVGIAKAFYLHPLIRALWPRSLGLPGDAKPKEFKDIPATPQLTKYLPGYIPSRTFALALCDLVSPADSEKPLSVQQLRAALSSIPSQPGGQVPSGFELAGEARATLGRVLLPLLANSGEDLKSAREGIEQWFDDSMDRVSGWYKRHSVWILIAVATVVTLVLNADTVMVIRRLSQDKVLRESIVKMAEERVKAENGKNEEEIDPRLGNDSPEPMGEGHMREAKLSSDIARLQGELNALNLLGWRLPDGGNGATSFWKAFGGSPGTILEKLVGMLLTVAAVSFGAPFWFDLLNKLVNVRAGGPKPKKADEQKKEEKG